MTAMSIEIALDGTLVQKCAGREFVWRDDNGQVAESGCIEGPDEDGYANLIWDRGGSQNVGSYHNLFVVCDRSELGALGAHESDRGEPWRSGTVVDGTDDLGQFLHWTIDVPSEPSVTCRSCDQPLREVIVRNPHSGDEKWIGLCCDRQGDDLPESRRFPNDTQS